MVTFALPGDYDAASDTSITPKARPPLPFARRTYVPTPHPAKRFGTPQPSARKTLTTRDEVPASSLNPHSVSSSRNLFRASTVDESPSVPHFAPSLPQTVMRKAFAPAATPEPSRVYRETAADPTPRKVAARAPERELVDVRVPLPPADLTGEALAQRVPKTWNPKYSIYADTFLKDLIPPGFDDEQRRQYCCILDLRRLKYAADEIFVSKSWQLNMYSFLKDFEKSRSLILCRYGIEQIGGIKPLPSVKHRWNRDHGLPDSDESEAPDADPTPTKPAMRRKRKADDSNIKNGPEAPFSAVSAKRRAMVADEADEPTAVTPAVTPAPVKNKRKTSADDESPSKLHKAAPSSAKSLFEKIASKPAPIASTTPASKPPCNIFEGASAAAAKSLFATAPPKTTATSSLFSAYKPSPSPSPAPATPSPNIFGHLADKGSARNGAAHVDLEAEEESESESEPADSQETAQTEQHSVDTSGPGEVDSPSTSFNTKPAAAGLETAASSGTGTRESTPGRSLFDRVTKDKDGQLVRATPPAPAEQPVEAAAAAPVLNQTWNPAAGPIKFAPAPSAATNSIFGLGGGGGGGAAAAGSSLFATPRTAHANLFGAPKSSANDVPKTIDAEKEKTRGESDKEDDVSPFKKPAGEARPALQPGSFSSLFSTKPAVTGAADATGSSPAKPAMSLFGSVSKPDASSTSGLFGSAPKDATSLGQPSSSLFGAQPAQAEKQAEEKKKNTGVELPKTNSFFAASAAVGTPANLFARKPATNGTSLFGGASAAPSTPLFGSTAPGASPAKIDATPAAPKPAAPPAFSFGASTTKPTLTSQAAATSLFGAPKSPLEPADTNTMGSPMKQDAASPAKKPFLGVGANTSQPPPVFSFGAAASTPAPSLFGSSAAPASNMGAPSGIFGGSLSAAAAAPSGPSAFNFTFGGSGAPSEGAAVVNNPFASSNAAPAPSSGGMFNFGGASAPPGGSGGPGPGPGPGPVFQFGGPSSTPAVSSPAPLFGGASSSGLAAPAAAPQQPPSGMFTFGGNQPSSTTFGSTLQPPAGGSSTTGTNSPFNLGGGSSLATTPAGGTPEPTNQAALHAAAPDNNNNDEDGEKHEQISLTQGAETEKNEETLHEVRAKVLKFAGASAEGEDKAKSKSPWVTQGLGPLRLLKHRETNTVRLLLRAEPRGNVALNKLLLPNMTYKADEKYVKLTTSNNAGDGLETWMIQVKTKDMAKALAEALEKNKEFNRK